ncbi:sigma factor-like helix-turn-helix DNA-binding protein [Streptomyces chilikensis]|uniref:Sigma factor-like helix-turn-helix DNA-binding protein n=1 Tax=Streptomyces chilikensis TaxID=1194079 RepID=A0ABV3EJC7_9ACTN
MTDPEEEVQRVLEAIDALVESGPPLDRAKRSAEVMTAVQTRMRRARRQAVQELKDGGMTLREIAAELGISFGRVRQILADDPDKPAPE